ncbi:sialin-like isoform X1 [Tribolium castaneum]|uniref:sialin-like isoform X1 n=1 Tax=Tribolium castaneum TaxID=7070 RepID=UPI0030FF31A9
MDSSESLQQKKVSCLPQRYVTALMLFIGVYSSYIILIMPVKVLPHIAVPLTTGPSASSACNRTTNWTFVPISKTLYSWDLKAIKLTRGSFFIGYMLFLIPAGVISDKYGGKTILSVSTLAAAINSIVTPSLIKISNGNYILVAVLRIIAGLASASLFPSINSIMSYWVPLCDRGKLSAVVYSGTVFASLVNNVATHRIVYTTRSWAAVYYIYGSIALVWAVFFHLLCSSHPWNNRFVTQDELGFLERNLGSSVTLGAKPIPWKSIMQSGPVWALIFAHVAHIWIWFVMVVNIPEYLNQVIRLDFAESASLLIYAYLTMAVLVVFFGFLVDYLIKKEVVSLINLRIIFSTFGLVGPGIFTLSAAYSGCNKTTVSVTVGSALATMSCYYAGTWANSLEIAPNYSGVIMGFANVVASLSWVILPEVMENHMRHDTLEEWKGVFWLHLIVIFVANILFIALVSTDEQDWNSTEVDPSPSSSFIVPQ